MVQVTIGGVGKFKSTETNIIKSFVINTISFIGIFHKLVDGKGGVIRLYDSVGNLWGRYN